MRYQKGSLGLNGLKDTAILRFVADSGCVTHGQLARFARMDYGEWNRRVFNWRIRRLVSHHLVRKQVVPYLEGESLYSITRAGVQALEILGVTFLGATLEREKDAREARIPHALALSAIRLTMQATGILWQWIPESFIRVMNLSPVSGYEKVYDAIATIWVNEERARIAIEYERTLKSQTKYEKIRDAIEHESQLNGFLYLVPIPQMVLNLIYEFRGTRRLIFFGSFNEFKEKVLDAEVRAANYHYMTLREALQLVIKLEKSKQQKA